MSIFVSLYMFYVQPICLRTVYFGYFEIRSGFFGEPDRVS